MLTRRFVDAVEYAAHAHAAQTRKGTDIPYLSHLLAVAALVLEDGGSEDDAVAALLHDVVEDQGGWSRLFDVRDRFGDHVGDLVEACTDYDVKTDRDPWPERKQRYVDHIAEMPEAVRRISLADKLHNARTILRDHRAHGEQVWERFNAGRDAQLWYYRALADAFAAVSDSPSVVDLQMTVAALETAAAPAGSGVKRP
jgi:(p)ppGpp synthase/HD superfamily hydrolase